MARHTIMDLHKSNLIIFLGTSADQQRRITNQTGTVSTHGWMNFPRQKRDEMSKLVTNAVGEKFYENIQGEACLIRARNSASQSMY